MNIFNRFARINGLLSPIACAMLLFFSATFVLPSVAHAQQTVDPVVGSVCTPGSLVQEINAQTGTFKCYPNSPGSAAGTWRKTYQSGMQVAYALYNFSVDGGAIATIVPAVNTTIPNNAIIVGVIANPTTALTSGGSATIAIGTSAGSSTTALKAATAVASYSIDAIMPGAPVFTAGSAVKLSAAGTITLTVAVATVTAGVMEVFVFYVVPTNS